MQRRKFKKLLLGITACWACLGPLSLLTGSAFAISDVTLDNTFGTGGKVITDIGTASDDPSNAIALQTDGKILVAGSSNASGSIDFAVVRYNTNGTLDTTFGTGGKVTTDIGTASRNSGFAIALQTDGKIIVAGDTTANTSWDFAVVRYNTDGSLDTTFGVGGKVTTNIDTTRADVIHAIALQTDGKIIVTGGSSDPSGPWKIAVVRYNTNGSLDTTFDTDGKVTTDIGTTSDDAGLAIALQTDGKIIIAGYSNASGSNDFAVVRYNTNGSLDTTFDTDGKVTTDIGTTSDDSGGYAISLQTDGKIILAGTSNASGSYDFTLVRYNTNGSLDTTFGVGGKVTTDIGTASSEMIQAIALQTDGKIIVAGWSDASGSQDFAVVRYNTNGSLDTTFGVGGKVITGIGTASSEGGFGIALQTDGKIIVGGFSNASGSNDFVVLRFTITAAAAPSTTATTTSVTPTTTTIAINAKNSTSSDKDLTLPATGSQPGKVFFFASCVLLVGHTLTTRRRTQSI